MAANATLRQARKATVTGAPAIEVAATVVETTTEMQSPDEVKDIESTTSVCKPAGSEEKFDEALFAQPEQASGEPAQAPAPPSIPAASAAPTTVGATTATPRQTISVPVKLETSTAVAKPAGPGQFEAVSGGALIGDFNAKDIKFPQLKIVQGSSVLKERFLEGTVVFGDDGLADTPPLPKPGSDVAPPPPTFRFIPVVIRKAYRQNLSDAEVKAGNMPQIVDTLAEVEAQGGTTQWIGKTKPSWSECAQCMFVLERPATGVGAEHPGFPVEIGEKFYAAAAYAAGGAAWRHVAQLITNTALTSLLVPRVDGEGKLVRDAKNRPIKDVCVHRNFWQFSVKRVKAGEHLVFQPRVILLKEETNPELRDYCAQLLNAGERAQADE